MIRALRCVRGADRHGAGVGPVRRKPTPAAGSLEHRSAWTDPAIRAVPELAPLDSSRRIRTESQLVPRMRDQMNRDAVNGEIAGSTGIGVAVASS